ncbi:MAG: hypothetical protein R3B13_33305 [Polyangiaceae bacterium]
MDLHPYLVATPALRDRLCLAPLGHAYAGDHSFDPMRRASAAFLDRLQQLDEATFGREGMAMPRWAFYDCAELPGAVLGLGARAMDLPPTLRADFSGSKDDTFLPLSMYMAIPTLAADEWLGYSLCALDVGAVRFRDAELDIATLALAVATLRAKRITGTVQWKSHHLAAPARFAPLAVLAAWLPAHTRAETCVFRFDVEAERIEAALTQPPLPAEDVSYLDSTDAEAQRAAQARIERGERAFIVGMPVATDVGQRIPLRWEAS